MSTVINAWTNINGYRTAKCGQCLKKLTYGEKIVSVTRAQGSFNSVTNYHLDCAEPIIEKIVDETVTLMNNLLAITQEIKTPQETVTPV